VKACRNDSALFLNWFIPEIFLIFATLILNNTNMNKGTVKFFNVSKGFGFIKDADSDNEYFVHATGLIDKVKENDEVTFELAEGKKGINAVNVRLA
jgi:CspA family cold shock protein